MAKALTANILITKYLVLSALSKNDSTYFIISCIHLYTSELLLPGEEQEVGTNGLQRVEGSLQALKVAPSLATERIFHHFVETHHPEALPRIWLIGPEQSCGRGQQGLAVLMSPFVALWCSSHPCVFLFQTSLQRRHVPPKEVLL